MQWIQKKHQKVKKPLPKIDIYLKRKRQQIPNRAKVIFALFLLVNLAAAIQMAPLQKRCIWVLRESMYNPVAIDSALSYAAENQFNTVFLQVRARGDALYKSHIIPMNHRVIPNFDPLEYALELGHELGLEIHAWMNMYILWSNQFEPESPQHIYHTHPEWTEANSYGKMDCSIDISRPPSPQWEGVYLSPLHPEVNPYLVSVVKDLIDHYPVDGIHLDYIRFQDDYYGYNPAGREGFKEQSDIDPMDIARGIISTRFGWQKTFVDSLNNAWQQYRQKSVTDLVMEIHRLTRTPMNIQLSAAVKPNIDSARLRWSQDWPLWITHGYVDMVVPMNYYKEIHYFTNDLKLIKNTINPEHLDQVIMGIATYNQDNEMAADKVLLARMNGFSGVSIFSYNSHRYNLAWFQPLLDVMGSPPDPNK